ncbi:MAG: thioredoxin domain-containing protein [Anaerolineales bacterium]|nr:thioredoxin domain-containing protein [Anaerolineales bacterium]
MEQQTSQHVEQPGKIKRRNTILIAAAMMLFILLAVLLLESIKNENGESTAAITATETYQVQATTPVEQETVQPTVETIEAAAVESTKTPREFMEILAGDGPYQGAGDAPVIIVEFSDYMCPFCGRFYLETLPLILETYPDEVKFVHKDFLNFGETSLDVAMSVHCAAEQGKYDAMQAVYFGEFEGFDFENFHHGAGEQEPGEQEPGDQDWQEEFKKGYDEEEIYTFAEEAGLDLEEFAACMHNQTYQEEILYDYAIAQQIGISGIPFFVINGMGVSGAQPFEIFQEVIEEALSAQ